jgi:tetratricopeptide (TPR) repeat protein
MGYRLLLIPLLFFIFSCKEEKASKKLAENYFKEQNYEQALAELDKLIRQEPDSINHYSLRVMTYSNLGMFKEEILDLNKIIELNIGIKSINAHNERAIAYLRIGENNKALEDINYVIENKDDSSDINQAYIQKASILYVLNDLENSKEFYQKALESNDNKDNEITTQALIGLSNISTNANESLKLLNKAIEIDSENGMAFGARGAIYLEQENIESALKDFQKAKKYDSYNPDIQFNIGQLYANYTNNLDSATYYFEKAIKLAPQSPKNDMIYTNLGVIKHRSGKLAEAMQDFETAEKLNSENDLLLYNYAMLLSDEEEYSKALIRINKAIEINSKDPEYYNLKGTILMDKSDFNESERAFKKAIEINPNYGTPYYNLGYLKSKQNNIEEGIKYYDIAIELDFDLPATLVNRALLKIKLDKIQEACSDLNKALKLGRTDIKPLIQRNCR